MPFWDKKSKAAMKCSSQSVKPFAFTQHFDNSDETSKHGSIRNIGRTTFVRETRAQESVEEPIYDSEKKCAKALWIALSMLMRG